MMKRREEMIREGMVQERIDDPRDEDDGILCTICTCERADTHVK